MNAYQNITRWLATNFPEYRLRSVIGNSEDFYIIFLISVPLSLLLFLLFSKYRHYILVDLGFHKWLIK